MLLHTFKYRLKCLLRDKERLFWTLFFPLLLATLFYFAFGHCTSERERFQPIKTAVVDNQAYRLNENFRHVLGVLGAEGEGQVLDLYVVGSKEALDLFDTGAVCGIITVTETAKNDVPLIGITVGEQGLYQSILKAILDEYTHLSQTIKDIAGKNPHVAKDIIKAVSEGRGSYINEISFSRAVPDTMLTYFYSLIAMACMYTNFWGLRNAQDIQSDLSTLGARRNAAPSHKLGIVLADISAALVVSYGEILILLAYVAFVLKIDFGNQVVYVLLTCFFGSISGVSFGYLVGTLGRIGENAKIGISMGGSMLMSFFAGLMYPNMKYIIAQKAPFFSFVNPAILISDAFYSLYVFDNHRRFFVNIAVLGLLSALMCGASYIRLRRVRYASL